MTTRALGGFGVGVMIGTGSVFSFLGLRGLPVSAAASSNAHVVVTVGLSAIFLHQPLGRTRGRAMALTLLGVTVLALSPRADRDQGASRLARRNPAPRRPGSQCRRRERTSHQKGTTTRFGAASHSIRVQTTPVVSSGSRVLFLSVFLSVAPATPVRLGARRRPTAATASRSHSHRHGRAESGVCRYSLASVQPCHCAVIVERCRRSRWTSSPSRRVSQRLIKAPAAAPVRSGPSETALRPARAASRR